MAYRRAGWGGGIDKVLFMPISCLWPALEYYFVFCNSVLSVLHVPLLLDDSANPKDQAKGKTKEFCYTGKWI